MQEADTRNERAQDAHDDCDSEALALEEEEEVEKNALRAEPTKKRGRAARKTDRVGNEDKEAPSPPVKRRLSFSPIGDADEEDEAQEDPVSVCMCALASLILPNHLWL